MPTAALTAGWNRRTRALAGPWGSGGSRPGVPFLTHLFDGAARIIIEIAWGADLTADADTWSWTDISGDVFYGGGGKISITLGRADEASASQPATCSMRLNNEAGLYSLGQQSPTWPNVRRNTPVRVRVDLGSGPTVLWFGFADGFTPDWRAAGRNAMVSLKASGILRRLIQGASPLHSAFRRSSTSAEVTNVVAYWPCEDGKDATSIASALPGGFPLQFYIGPPDFGSSDAFPCSAPLPKLNGSAWYGAIAPYTDTGETQIRALISIPEAGGTDDTTLFRLHTTGTSDLWELRHKTGFGGVLSIRAWGAGVILLDQDVDFDINGQLGQFGLQLTQNGANVDWNIDVLRFRATSGGGFAGTLNNRTVGIGFKMEVNINDANDDVTFGHLTVQNAITDEAVQIAALNAHTGEVGPERITRLCAENMISAQILGNNIPGDGATTACGFQGIDTLVKLLRECEVVDQGVLHDGLVNGFTYITRRRRENAEPFLVVDVTAGDFAGALDPDDDDQRNVNTVVAARTGASSYTHTDIDGPLGTEAIGTYDTSATVNNDSDGEIAHYASWLVHLGTVEGYRYPKLELDLTHSPHLIAQWITALLGGRIDVLGIESALTQHPAGTISLALLGYTHEIDQFRWRVLANTSAYSPWRVGVWAADSGDTDPNVLRFDTDGSSLAEPVAAGAASLSVATPSGPLWTTLADDCPMTIDLGDVDLGVIHVTVTGITGASSPQTFTVDPATLTVQRPAGTPVSVDTPPLGL